MDKKWNILLVLIVCMIACRNAESFSPVISKIKNPIQLTFPYDNLQNAERNVELHWKTNKSDRFQLRYRVYIGFSKNSVKIQKENITEEFHTLKNLKFKTKYYWKVEAYSENEKVSSKIYSFTTKIY